MDQRIIELEKRISFQEIEIAELKSSLNEHYELIKTLTSELNVLRKKLESEQLVRDIKDEEPPPHF